MPNFSLGWELEATNRARKVLTGIEVDHDGSVNGEQIEYRVSKKLVFNPRQSLAALRALCSDPYLRTDESCGFHVHVGLGVRSKRIHQWAAAFVTLARHVETEAFAAVPGSRTGSTYCRSWKNSPDSILDEKYPKGKHSCPNRYNWVNPVEIFRPGGIRTIEIRLMGDTHRYLYLLAWISFCRRMAASAWLVSLDISKEHEEVRVLKQHLGVISDMFRLNMHSSKQRITETLEMARIAGLYDSKGSVLSTLSNREWASSQPYYVKRQRVKCVEVPHDGNMRVGQIYTIIDGPYGCGRSVMIRGDNGCSWSIEIKCIIPLTNAEETEELRTCAV